MNRAVLSSTVKAEVQVVVTSPRVIASGLMDDGGHNPCRDVE